MCLGRRGNNGFPVRQIVSNCKVRSCSIGTRELMPRISTPTTRFSFVEVKNDSGLDLFGLDDRGLVETEVEGIALSVNLQFH